MKLGRNDPCPCGSGKKYKHCHLDADRQAERSKKRLAEDRERLGSELIIDPVAVWFGEVMEQIDDFDERIGKPRDDVLEDFLPRIGDGLEGQAAAEALEEYLAEVEEKMAGILGHHSRALWLHLSRRMPPQPIAGASVWTAALYRRILTLALLKHGKTHEPDGSSAFQQMETAGRESSVPANLDADDVINLHALLVLADEFAVAAAAYRRIGKGAVLRRNDEYFDTPADDALEALIKTHDERLRCFGSLTSPYGAVTDYDFPEEAGQTSLVTLALVPNFEGHLLSELQQKLGINYPGPPNYLLGAIALDDIRARLLHFEAEATEVLGSSPDAVLGAIWALSTRLTLGMPEDPRVALQLMRTGYYALRPDIFTGRYPEDAAGLFRAWWHEIRGEEIEPDTARRLSDDAIEALSYTEDELASLSLWDRLPVKLYVVEDEMVFVDYDGIGEVISGLFREVGFLDGNPGNVRATSFEDVIVARLNEEGAKLWESGRELIAHDESRREIDTSVILGDRLVIIECKAFSQNPRIDRGDFAALKGRRETLEHYLEQAESLADFLRRNRNGRNFDVPAEVKTIDYCLCAPGVEWIWGRDDELWLTEEIPRICTPDELVAFLSSTPLR